MENTIKATALRMLKAIYETWRGRRGPVEVSSVAGQLGIEFRLSNMAVNYLVDKQLLVRLKMGMVRLTSNGIDAIEDALAHPDRPTESIPGVTINTINIHGSNVGLVQQAGKGSAQSATVTFNASAVQSALEDFAVRLQYSDVPDDIKSAAMLEIDTIRPQLKKPKPSMTIVREGLHTLRNILEGVVAGALASKLMMLMTMMPS